MERISSIRASMGRAIDETVMLMDNWPHWLRYAYYFGGVLCAISAILMLIFVDLTPEERLYGLAGGIGLILLFYFGMTLYFKRRGAREATVNAISRSPWELQFCYPPLDY